MEPLAQLAKSTGILEGIRHCFASVFGELNLASEAWAQSANLLTIGRDNYAEFIERRIGLFPLFATSRTVSVDSAFVRVSLSAEIERERYRSKEHIAENLRRQREGMPISDPRFENCLSGIGAIEVGEEGFALIGNAGSGKTTLFRAITLHAAKGNLIRGRKRIPIFIAARDIRTEGSLIINEAISFFENLDIPVPERVVAKMLESGSLMILLDGIDETELVVQREIIDDIQQLRARYPKAVFCISSRPYSLSLGLAGFKKWETLPLQFEDRLVFVQKWFAAVDPDKGARLIEVSKDRPEMLDLGSSPLLLSIVCALFYNDLDIPKEPEELYDRAVHGILGGWDAFRNIARDSPLAEYSIKKRTVLLTVIAISLFEKGKLVFSVEDLTRANCIEVASSLLRVELPEPDILLRSLYNDFGLLIERAPDLYSFSHLTLEEFLTARYIVDNRRERRLLLDHARDFEWAEVIRMTGRLQPNADEFLRLLMQGARFHVLSDVFLVKDVWLSRPICSPELRKELIAGIAREIAKAAKSTYAEFDYEPNDPSGGELIVRVAPRKDMAKIQKLILNGAKDQQVSVADEEMESDIAKIDWNPANLIFRGALDDRSEIPKKVESGVSLWLVGRSFYIRFADEKKVVVAELFEDHSGGRRDRFDVLRKMVAGIEAPGTFLKSVQKEAIKTVRRLIENAASEWKAASQRDRKKQAAKEEKGMSQYSHWLVITNSLPILLDVIRDSEYSIEELQVADTAIFTALPLNLRTNRVRIQMDESLGKTRKRRK